MNILFAFRQVDRVRTQECFEAVWNTRAVVEVILRAAIILVLVRRPLPARLSSSTFSIWIGEIFARVETDDNPTGGNTAVPIRICGACRLNSARADLTKGLR